MQENASRRGAVDMGMPLMILAFIVMAGFVWWLKGQSDAEMEARELAAAELAAAEAEEDAREALVQLGNVTAVGTDPDAFVGEEIHADGYEVASLLGTQGFWVTTAGGNPFLVSWGPELMAAGQTVAPGDTIEGYGEMKRMTPELLDEWTAAGTMTDNDRIIAEFATHYVEAHTVNVLGGPSAGGGN